MDCTCMNWAREGGLILTDHHPTCPRREEELAEMLRALCRGIESWAQDEDGVPDECWDAYRCTKAKLGERVP